MDENYALDVMSPVVAKTCKAIHNISHMMSPFLEQPIGMGSWDVAHNTYEINRFNDDDNKTNRKKNKIIFNGAVERTTNKDKDNSENAEKIGETEPAANNSSNNKRKKKKNSDKDKPRLNKTNSVCSSLSDMSFGSGKQENTRAVIDIQAFEKQLNELHRMVEKSVSFVFSFYLTT